MGEVLQPPNGDMFMFLGFIIGVCVVVIIRARSGGDDE